MSVIDNAVRKAESILGALKDHGVQFEIHYNGTVLGGIPRVGKNGKPRKKHTPPTYPRGELIAYVKNVIDDMAVGDVRRVPFGKYNKPTVQSSTASTANVLWGKESYTTHRVEDGVELLRLK